MFADNKPLEYALQSTSDPCSHHVSEADYSAVDAISGIHQLSLPPTSNVDLDAMAQAEVRIIMMGIFLVIREACAKQGQICTKMEQ